MTSCVGGRQVIRSKCAPQSFLGLELGSCEERRSWWKFWGKCEEGGRVAYLFRTIFFGLTLFLEYFFLIWSLNRARRSFEGNVRRTSDWFIPDHLINFPPIREFACTPCQTHRFLAQTIFKCSKNTKMKSFCKPVAFLLNSWTIFCSQTILIK